MHLIVAKPRGFCAGVERAIKTVEWALQRYGPPVYVLNHIVHNAHVVNALREKGAVFVHDLEEVPQSAPLLFSAHGVGPDRWEEAQKRSLQVVDATCPLVEKVHREARRFSAAGYTVILIGKDGHDETIGTMGWAEGHVKLVQSISDVAALEVEDESKLAYITQTTLSVGDCQEIADALKKRFPDLHGPSQADICYATSNRQFAVNALASEVDLVLVVGDGESANSTRLAEVARAQGRPAHLIPSAEGIRGAWLEGVERVLITSGASVPEELVRGVIRELKTYGECHVEERELVQEDIHFRLPKPVG